MKWFNCVQIVTGQTFLHIAMHLLVIITLVYAWKYNVLVAVSSAMVLAYVVLFVAMLIMQRIPSLRWVGDSLEEATTTYYFGAGMLMLFLFSHFIHNSLLLVFLGLVMLVGPELFSLLVKDLVQHLEKKRSDV